MTGDLVCTRCGRSPLVFDRRVGVYRADDGGNQSANCENDHSPAWRHTPDPLTKRQLAAVERAGGCPAPVPL